MDTLIPKLIERSRLSFESIKQLNKKRFFIVELERELKSKSIIILAGPRGVGKTIILKQLIQNEKAGFYLSVDQLSPEQSLFELAKLLESKYKIKYLILDEIHFNHNYAVDLKAIYDSLKIKVLVTSSIALKLEELSVDLSRRAKFFQMFPFSLREYIYFEKNVILEPISFENVLKRKWSAEHLEYGYLFREYLKGRLYPFTLQEDSYERLFRNIYEKILKVDIPQIGKLSSHEVLQLEKLMAFIGRAQSEGVSVSSLSKNLSITKYKIEEYLKLLTQAYILQVLYPKGTSVTREPKVLMTLPYRLLFKDFEDAVGSLREDYVVEILRAQGMININYLKSTRGEKTPDFYIEDARGNEMVIEVGGKGKGRTQFKGIEVDKKYIFVDSLNWKDNQYPLFMLGMY